MVRMVRLPNAESIETTVYAGRDRLTRDQIAARARRVPRLYEPAYSPDADLKQAMVGYYLIAAMVLTALALAAVLLAGG